MRFRKLNSCCGGTVIVIENGKELDEREYEKGVYFEFFQKLTEIEN